MLDDVRTRKFVGRSRRQQPNGNKKRKGGDDKKKNGVRIKSGSMRR